MKVLKITTEVRAYSEEEAKEYIEEFRAKAAREHYTVSAAGYTYKTKTKKGEVVAEAWVCKCVAEYNKVWEGDE